MKGYELPKEIADKNITLDNRVKVSGYDFTDEFFVNEGTIKEMFRYYTLETFLNADFEIIPEESDEIDIDSIEQYLEDEIEYMCLDKVKPLAYKINELIKAVKQLNKKLED